MEKDELGKVTEIEHQIDTVDSPPVRQPPRRVPFAIRPDTTRMVNEMLGASVMQEYSSPWASPVVLVRKKSGELRFCVDYRRLNTVTRKDVFPLPRIDDMLDQLSGKCVFSTLDARSGYWQIQVEVNSRPKTAFVTINSLYEFRMMPFGLCNTPATFQRVIQRAMAGLSDFCSVYIDDIIVFSGSVQEHLLHLAQVFGRLRRIGLKRHPHKCRFAYQEVRYLGHITSATGFSPDPVKVTTVREFQVPTNAKAVRAFVGLASYYRHFVPNFARIAAPLHGLTRKDVAFEWTPCCQEDFECLKDCLTTPPVLAYPRFDKPFVLHTDASGQGLGAVLEQEQEDGQLHLVAYASQAISKHEANYGITDLEALGVVWAAKYFRAYLFGHHSSVFTDHAPLRALLKAKHQSGKMALWAGLIAELNLDIQYRPGRKNANADALSRALLPARNEDTLPNARVMEVTTEDPVGSPPVAATEMAALQAEDKHLQQVLNYLQEGALPSDEGQARKLVPGKDRFMVSDGVLYYVDPGPQHRLRLVVPSSMRHRLMEELHSGPFGGHFAGRGLYRTLAQHYWWDGMFSDITHHCRSC